MKTYFLFFAIFSQIITRSLGITTAQISLLTTNNLVLGGTSFISGGNDSTMQSATANNLASARAVYKFVKDSTPIYCRSGISVTTSGSGAASYSSPTGVINIPTFSQYVPAIYNNVVRSLSNSFTISTTQQAFFCYSIQINATVTLGTSNSVGTVTPQYSINGGTTWISLPKISISPTLTTLLTLTILSSQTIQVNGFVPANALVKIVTSGSGTFSMTYIDGQEVY